MAHVIHHHLDSYHCGESGKSVAVATPSGEASIARDSRYVTDSLMMRSGWRYSQEVSQVVKLREEGPDHAKTVVFSTDSSDFHYNKPEKSRIRSTESAESIVQALVEAGFRRPPVKTQSFLGAVKDEIVDAFRR
ncbi:MAG: hypothetical protein PW734_01695 [Verrucomicrobium sp.]|nr:hypothetical protein [Verrucomicrobium sp.]